MARAIAITPELVTAAAFDVGNRSCFGRDLRGAGMPGSKAWSRADAHAACTAHERLTKAAGFVLPSVYAIKIRKVSERRRNVPQSSPIRRSDFVKVR